jgi:hypothetical protein
MIFRNTKITNFKYLNKHQIFSHEDLSIVNSTYFKLSIFVRTCHFFVGQSIRYFELKFYILVEYISNNIQIFSDFF